MSLIKIYDTNEQEIDMDALGLAGLRLRIPSPSYRTNTQEIDGRSGAIVIDRVLEPRNLVAEFVSIASDYIDSLVLRDKLYEVLGNGRSFYVSETKHPLKRWKVYFNEWDLDRFDSKTFTFQIPLIVESGTSESVSITERIFTTATFSFNNEGNQTIDPRIHSETQIEFSGASSGLSIRNLTTGDEWSWSGSTIQGDILLLKGIQSFKNGQSIFAQTNKKLISFKPGLNDFQIVGATATFQLTIRTRFYFL